MNRQLIATFLIGLTIALTPHPASSNQPPTPNTQHPTPNTVRLSAHVEAHPLITPVHGIITSGYGWRHGRLHQGIDIGAPIGTPIVAAASGLVEFVGDRTGYGHVVEIRHPNGSMTRYAHNSRNLVAVGDCVEQGQAIATVGQTGRATGPHLHFELHVPEQGTVNPIAYLPTF